MPCTLVWPAVRACGVCRAPGSERDKDDHEEDDHGMWEGSPPNSCCSMSRLKPRKSNTASVSTSSGASSSVRKRERMRKMVKALRGIIPGGDRLDTPAILDEAVKYLKSLKTEMKQLGIQNFGD
ncbi:transcription factor bHLH144-like [Phoenix dactylifera]|uniref:Transcription factor bHLH144-like n=1 Tax=Phoenix dactylifera TaxID=42345 RepID=A0A8B7MSF3_PHODC|nr:transcription factor bHLH144-like [Phoenix dactylifera]